MPQISSYLGDLVLAENPGIACGNEPSIFDAAGMISSSMRGPEQNLEFMAKKLLYRSESPKVLIGTPLYVAMAE